MGTIHTNEKRSAWWEVDRFDNTVLALEQDFLSSRQLVLKMRLRRGPAETIGEHSGSTSGARITLEDRSCMDGLQNSVATCVVMLENVDHY